MFFGKCPGCGSSNITSAEPSTYTAKHSWNQWLQQQAAAGHPHPGIKAAVLATGAIYEVYKRLPGGGKKQCRDCGHVFS
ncbi:hypothetical protein P1X14_12310 [Sphingomonas sp. AOB5]|uniref:hypothetical protein n=1 Tax=Sphingomonas sp. AOB5 TaxID=3034017 RepID=UPI0023F74AF5|nr:hypothetical protein [Sphingomonas sp. AOB5]MDF7776033.1 hypothetical protein [Sphingomonas sp. AOB5]